MSLTVGTGEGACAGEGVVQDYRWMANPLMMGGGERNTRLGGDRTSLLSGVGLKLFGGVGVSWDCPRRAGTGRGQAWLGDRQGTESPSDCLCTWVQARDDRQQWCPSTSRGPQCQCLRDSILLGNKISQGLALLYRASSHLLSSR